MSPLSSYVTFSPARRIELLRLAIDNNFYILEDDYAYDFHYSNNPVPPLERSLSEFIKSGELQRHLKKVVKIYRHRRDYFCDLLQTHLSDHVTFMKPEGGMSVWVVFKNGTVLQTLPARLAKEGYLIEIDNIFLKKLNGVRMGFASLNEREMERLVGVMRRILFGTR